MNKIFNYFTMLFFSVLALSLGSCTEEFEYTGTSVSGEQVYFSNALPTTVELSATANSITVPVNRIQRSGELTVNLDVTVPEGSPLTVSNQATFADGDSVAYVTISYDPNAIEYGKYDTITVAINDASLTTPYGNTSYTFAAGLSEWSSVAGANTGYYTEGIISSLYQLTSLVYPVEIQSNVLRPGVYRIISPYGPGTEFYSSYVNDNGFIWAGDGRNTDIVIDATDPDYVYVSGDFYPGTDDGNGANGQGVLHVFSFVDAYLASGNPLDLIKSSAPELFGTLVDGIITIPASALAANFDDTLTPYYYANGAEIKIALPGYVISDYSSSFVYNGCFIDVAGNSYLQGTVMLGEDVASAKYVIASSGDDVQAIIDAVNDGSIEGTEIRESGDVSVALSESGNYNFIIITYDAAGNMQGSSATSFTFTSGGSSWEAVAYGTYQQNYKPNFVVDENDQAVGNPFGTGSYQTTLYVDPSNASRYKLDPWIADGVSLVFTMSNDGIISFPQTDTGAIVEGYGTVYAVNANEVYPGYGPFSAYTQDGVFIFGVMFGINVDGKMEWLGGASEIFTPTGEAGVPPMKGFGLQRSVKNFGKKPFRNSKVKLNNAMKVKKFVKKTVDMK